MLRSIISKTNYLEVGVNDNVYVFFIQDKLCSTKIQTGKEIYKTTHTYLYDLWCEVSC